MWYYVYGKYGISALIETALNNSDADNWYVITPNQNYAHAYKVDIAPEKEPALALALEAIGAWIQDTPFTGFGDGLPPSDKILDLTSYFPGTNQRWIGYDRASNGTSALDILNILSTFRSVQQRLTINGGSSNGTCKIQYASSQSVNYSVLANDIIRTTELVVANASSLSVTETNVTIADILLDFYSNHVTPDVLAESTGANGTNLFDSDISTSGAIDNDTEYWVFDFGTLKYMNKLGLFYQVNTGNGLTFTFYIDYSTDNQNWTNVYSRAWSAANTNKYVLRQTVNATLRYLRFRITTSLSAPTSTITCFRLLFDF